MRERVADRRTGPASGTLDGRGRSRSRVQCGATARVDPRVRPDHSADHRSARNPDPGHSVDRGRRSGWRVRARFPTGAGGVHRQGRTRDGSGIRTRGASHQPPQPSPAPRSLPARGFPDGSTFTDCFVGDLPVEDHWFGFADAGRAFHVLVIIGRAASSDVRDEAWSILDRLRFDPDVRPDWKAST